MLIEKVAIRFSQRAVAEVEYYGNRKVRMDEIIVESEEKIHPTMKHTHFLVWLVKSKAFVRIPNILQQFWKVSESDSCRFPSSVVKLEFCLYESIQSRQLSVDIVDRKLRCVRATWDHSDGVKGIVAASRSFRLVSSTQYTR